MVDLSVVIPVYNERESIGKTVEEIHAAFEKAGTSVEYEVIVVDDGSDDGSGAILAEMSNIRLLSHKRNRGYGAALKSGIRSAEGKVIAITDADGTYPNRMLPELHARMDQERLDMVVAARTGDKVYIPLLRRPAKWVLNILANYMTGTRIPDLNSGLRLFKKEIAMKFFPIISDGFSFTTTLTLATMVNDFNVEFVPIDYAPRKGRSKIRPLQDTLNFLMLIVRTIAFFNPLKVFIPVSLVIFIFALACLVYQIIIGDVGDFSVILFLSSLQIFLIGIIADLVVRKPHN
ncbi:MAG: glycosyltransferase family 2 protein [Planctomycetota bacterium]